MIEEKKKEKKWSILTPLVNLALLITLVFMGMTFDLLKNGYGLIYANKSPISLLTFLFIVFVIIGIFLHHKQANWSTWVMIPILLFNFFGFISDLNGFSYIFKLDSTYDTEIRIAQHTLSKFKNIPFYLLVGVLGYITIGVFKIIKRK